MAQKRQTKNMNCYCKIVDLRTDTRISHQANGSDCACYTSTKEKGMKREHKNIHVNLKGDKVRVGKY